MVAEPIFDFDFSLRENSGQFIRPFMQPSFSSSQVSRECFENIEFYINYEIMYIKYDGNFYLIFSPNTYVGLDHSSLDTLSFRTVKFVT